MEVVESASEVGVPRASSRPGRVLRLPSVEERTGLKKSSVYIGIRNGTFPAPVKLSARLVGWREEDIERWIVQRKPAGTVA